ncbi:Transmembrane protein 45B [Oryzias melastigma]|uniref:Transmembrane protein 45B n=1 Tax=Oryzias melastigma TaxID=30732 RepID=A0A834FC95_ORYME|nr:Transmembrane protein 45B [Oryzias melastigma]
MVEQFVVDGPHAHLYNKESKSWVKLMNWQHSSMYLFFGISGIAMLLRTSSKLVPARIDRAALSLALFVEGESPKLFLLYWSHECVFKHSPVPAGFLFYFHVHARPPLDAHIHSLLLFPVFAGDNILLELSGACLFILQGSWFYQIGFVLYPLSGPEWDLNEHGNIMFVTMCFCWHLAVALFLVAGTSFIVGFTLTRLSDRRGDIEIGMRNTLSKTNSEKALLEESEEE